PRDQVQPQRTVRYGGQLLSVQGELDRARPLRYDRVVAVTRRVHVEHGLVAAAQHERTCACSGGGGVVVRRTPADVREGRLVRSGPGDGRGGGGAGAGRGQDDSVGRHLVQAAQGDGDRAVGGYLGLDAAQDLRRRVLTLVPGPAGLGDRRGDRTAEEPPGDVL